VKAMAEEKVLDVIGVDSINEMHLRWIDCLESNNFDSSDLVSFALDVSALYHDKEQLPHLQHFDKLVNILHSRFCSDLSEILKTADEQEQIIALDCYDDLNIIAQQRKHLSDEAGKAATLGKYICL